MSIPVSLQIVLRSEYSMLIPVFQLDNGVSDIITALPHILLFEEDQPWLIETVPVGLSNSWTCYVSPFRLRAVFVFALSGTDVVRTG